MNTQENHDLRSTAPAPLLLFPPVLNLFAAALGPILGVVLPTVLPEGRPLFGVEEDSPKVRIRF